MFERRKTVALPLPELCMARMFSTARRQSKLGERLIPDSWAMRILSPPPTTAWQAASANARPLAPSEPVTGDPPGCFTGAVPRGAAYQEPCGLTAACVPTYPIHRIWQAPKQEATAG